VNFMQWSSEHPHIARIVVQYGFGDAPQPADAPGDSRAVIAGDSPPAIPNAASLATPASTR
jgi:hypothetical protein